jgi:serine/threonine protein kinase
MIIANKYKIIEQIGEGAFGKIYKGENIRTKEFVAVKVEKKENIIKSLKYETQIYQLIGQGLGIAPVKWFGLVRDYYFMVMPLLGPSLSDLKKSHSNFSLNTTLCFGIEMIKVMQTLHEKGFIHRDVKPDNFLLGEGYISLTDPLTDPLTPPLGSMASPISGSMASPVPLTSLENKLYIVDFGCCKKYIADGKHIPICYNKALIGTPNYVSINMHNRIEPSRRDDLESIGYIMIYLLFPDEPKKEINWKTMTELIAFKMDIIDTDSPEQERRLGFRLTPLIIKKYLGYCKRLHFEQTPDYVYLISMLKEGLTI